ncbi:transcription factor TT2-like protein [Corchorus olitorius]|uniref:Transcription factor TT2-like protein n=1 Tax=Corchorus olitorius TaxID=93759 RepID=A0A1R3JAF5_9ROSI|nr:transcription factor TT2-like protein [Corchorus olitorius]
MEGRIGKKRKREAEMAPSPTAGSAKSSTHVVRTRAIRCSRKVFIDYPLPLLPHAQKQIFEYPFDSKTSSQPSTNGDYCLDIQIPQLFENDDEDQNNNNYNDSSDFMFDFNMGEISISDLLKSDFAELGEVNNSNDDILSPSTSDEQAAAAAAAAPLVFSEEMFEDWTSCSSQQNVASNLHCLAPFLDCGEEWFAE